MNDDYPTCERTYAELRIYGADLDPDEITNLLQITPSSTQRRGELRTGSGGRRERMVGVGGWFLSSENQVRSMDLRRHLDWILGQLDRRRDPLRRLQTKSGVEMSVHCIWWSRRGQGGPTLWPEQMKRLADLNLECGFEFSFFGEGEDEIDVTE